MTAPAVGMTMHAVITMVDIPETKRPRYSGPWERGCLGLINLIHILIELLIRRVSLGARGMSRRRPTILHLGLFILQIEVLGCHVGIQSIIQHRLLIHD